MQRKILYSAQDIIEELDRALYLLDIDPKEVERIWERIFREKHCLIQYTTKAKYKWESPMNIVVYERNIEGIIKSEKYDWEVHCFCSFILRKCLKN